LPTFVRLTSRFRPTSMRRAAAITMPDFSEMSNASPNRNRRLRRSRVG